MKRTIAILLLTLLGPVFGRSAEIKLKTVVIDPGHGGHDPGCISKDRKTYEKNLTLDISKKLAGKIREACPDVEVVMTRDRDVYVTLNDRAEIANRAEANLFISVHINAVPSTSPNGCSVHILGQSSNKDRDLFAYNMDVCRRENSVILMEEDYSTKYQGFDPADPESYIFMQLMQNAYLEQSLDFAQICSKQLKSGPIKTSKGIWQDPFYVLWKTSMPAVLVELGFISNSSDLGMLRQDSSRDDIADRLLAAFIEFKDIYDDSVDVNNEKVKTAPKSKTQPSAPESIKEPPTEQVNTIQASETQTKDDKTVRKSYGIQIFSLKTRLKENDSRLLGYEPVIVEYGNLYKYVICVSPDIERVREGIVEIRKTYPDCFIVTLQ